MASNAAVGLSLSEDPRVAGEEAARTAREALGREPSLALVFATTGHDPEPLLSSVRNVAGDVPLCGCSGEGIIGPDTAQERDHAVGVMLIASDSLTFSTELLEAYAESPDRAGRELAERIGEVRDAVALLVFPDGLVGNGTQFLTALEENLPVPILTVGGTAADAQQMERTFQFHGDRAVTGGCSAVLLRGRGRMDVEVSHGCLPIGLEREVTRADQGWVREIDGRKAWSVFQEYLDGKPEDLNIDGIAQLCIGEPLRESEDDHYPPFVIRTPMRVGPDGAMFFPSGGIREGRRIRLTRRDPERIRESAAECARRLCARSRGRKPALVLQWDCAGRGQVLFGSTVADSVVRPLQRELGEDLPWLGFHTYGEIAPLRGRTHFHNYTVVLCALYDE